ncbi:MAG: cytochrome c maturation protein CcmE [Gammaproteobacteria bacterium]|nr:cytochrome c maturation protein CcmE [Gammaproteobacteria bacterium]
MKPRNKRLLVVLVGLLGLATVATLVMNAFNSNMVFFYSPTQVLNNEAPRDHTFRLGGIVEEGSLARANDGLTVTFNVTDGLEIVPVKYVGILPDLFREGQGIVAQGKWGSDSVFTAKEVLAKHDENYMPPEVAEALEAAEKEKAAREARATAQENEPSTDTPVEGISK